jgi:hypothetical protein
LTLRRFEKKKREQMPSSDFFQRSDFSCTVEEIREDLEGSGGTILLEVKVGRVSATTSFWVCGTELEEFLSTIDVVRKANMQLSQDGGVFVGRGCTVREIEEGANVNKNDKA